MRPPTKRRGEAAKLTSRQSGENVSVLCLDVALPMRESAMDALAATEVDTRAFVGAGERLRDLASQTPEYRRARAAGVLRVEVGPLGLLLGFAGELPEAPLRCAVQLGERLASAPDLSIRMGVHVGRWASAAQRRANPGGTDAAAAAQAIAKLGDGGHVIVSSQVVDALAADARWTHAFRLLGSLSPACDDVDRVFNFVHGGVGISHVPKRFLSSGKSLMAAQADSGPRPVPQAPATFESRWVAVTFSVSEGSETLVFAPHARDDTHAGSSPVFVSVSRSALKLAQQTVRTRLEQLTQLALRGQPRGDLALEPPMTALAQLALPPGGLQRLVGLNIYPQLQLIQEITSQIPWEALEEWYFLCPKCGQHEPADVTGALPHAPFCRGCGAHMQPGGGKLAIAAGLAHVVPGLDPPTAKGNHFFLFEDPTGDLCAPANDESGICRHHHGELEYLLTEMGYEVSRFRGANVTCDRFLDALQDPEVLGIYYFGHGDSGEFEGSLRLADGPLAASRLRQVRALTPLLFINACEAASGSSEWSASCESRSVATALAGPSHWRTVIAPTAPVVSRQAAELAAEFFRAASGFAPAGVALREARMSSLRRYEGGQPDLSWALFRLFGFPQRPLPLPRAVTLDTGRAPSGMGVFDAAQGLCAEHFAFRIEEVLAAANRRKAACGRWRVSVLDFIVGLLTDGALTRYVLRSLVVDPDSLASRLSVPRSWEAPAPGPSPNPLPEGKQALTREHLDSDLVRLLRVAERWAQLRQADERRITERDTLTAVLAEPTWDKVAPLECCSADLRQRLAEVCGRQEVDENGQISLAGLAPEARRIVEVAHGYAQQRGAAQISHRVLFAAFLQDPGGRVARACHRHGVDTQELQGRLLGTPESDSARAATPKVVGLSPEVCERIMLPVLEDAKKRVTRGEDITEPILFGAFAECADPAFVGWLGSQPNLDFPGLARELLAEEAKARAAQNQGNDFEPMLALLSAEAVRVIRKAHHLAENLGTFPISSRILLAAFLTSEDAYAVRRIRQLCPTLRWQAIRDKLVERSTLPGRDSLRLALDARVCGALVVPMIEHASSLGEPGRLIGEQELFRAFCVLCGPEFKQALARREWGLDLDALLMSESKQAPPADAPQASADAPPESETPAAVSGTEAAAMPVEEGKTSGLPTGLRTSDLDAEVLGCLRRAARVAQKQGWDEMRSPHLFAAMLDEELPVPGHGILPSPLRRGLRRAVLSVVPTRPTCPAGITALSPNVLAILKRTIGRAVENGRTQATVDDLLQAFFADGGGIVGEVLARLGSFGPQSPVC